LEEYAAGTNPRDNDRDNDQMPNDWEVTNGLNSLQNDANGDADNDNLTNLEEYQYQTDPNDINSDDDGYSDSEEIIASTNPLDPTDYPQPTTLKTSIVFPVTITLIAAALTLQIVKGKKQRK